MKKTVLVTGGCGFIGSTVIAYLLRERPDIKLRVIDNFSTGTPDDLSEVTEFSMSFPGDCFEKQPKVCLIEGDIREMEFVKNCARGVESIIHLAANTGVQSSVNNPLMDMECNVVGTFNLLEACRINDVRKFIFASSGAPAGEVDPPIHEELPQHPVSPYGASKLAGEGYCSAYYRSFGVETVCLRFGNVYGPRSKNKSSVVAKFIRKALAGEKCLIYGDGAQTRDFIYIDDLVQAVFLSIIKNVGGQTFQIATGMESTVYEMAILIAKALKRRNIEMNIAYATPRIGDVRRNFSDTRKAREVLGWVAEMDVKDGIEKTVNYFFEENI